MKTFSPLMVSALSLAVLSTTSLVGCGDDKPSRDSGENGRSDAVTGSRSSSSSTTTARASAPTSAKPATPKKLCASPPAADGKKLPDVDFGHIEADGAPAIEGPIKTGTGWTWVNLWAGFCAPCKEEVPRLLKWKDDLKKAGTPIDVAFVSLDDDDRQGKQFLSAQPKDGLRSSLFLPEGGKARSQFLKDLSLKDPPELPVHILVDPAGAVRCVIQGAIDDGDYAQVSQIVSKK